jgi:hypothetical protein
MKKFSGYRRKFPVVLRLLKKMKQSNSVNKKVVIGCPLSGNSVFSRPFPSYRNIGDSSGQISDGFLR